MHVCEVGEQISLGFGTEGQVATQAYQEVDHCTRGERDVVHTVHLLDLVRESRRFRESQLGGHFRDVYVAAETGEKNGDGSAQVEEVAREPVVGETLGVREGWGNYAFEDLDDAENDRNDDEDRDADDGQH